MHILFFFFLMPNSWKEHPIVLVRCMQFVPCFRSGAVIYRPVGDAGVCLPRCVCEHVLATAWAATTWSHYRPKWNASNDGTQQRFCRQSSPWPLAGALEVRKRKRNANCKRYPLRYNWQQSMRRWRADGRCFWRLPRGLDAWVCEPMYVQRLRSM